MSPMGLPVFKTGALNRSASPPWPPPGRAGPIGLDPIPCCLQRKCPTIKLRPPGATPPSRGRRPPPANRYRPNSIKNAIISANRPIASDRANPSIVYVNNCCLSIGLRAKPWIRLPNTVPMPAPLPATPIVAQPAPTNFATLNSSTITRRAKGYRSLVYGTKACRTSIALWPPLYRPGSNWHAFS